MKLRILIAMLCWLLAMVVAARAHAQDLDKPVLVVATERLDGDRSFRRTVMLAVPMGELHVGVILNRPTQVKMGELYPEHGPSKNVTDPVYFGGPSNVDAIFAMVKADVSPGPGSLQLMAGLWLVSHASAIDHLIETKPNDARYYVGTVVWRPGELAKEIGGGLVVVKPADPEKLFLRDTSGLHEDLAPKKGRVET